MIETTLGEPNLTDEPCIEAELFRVEIRPTTAGDLLLLSGAVSLDAVQQLNEAALQALTGGRAVTIDWAEARRVCAGAVQVLLVLRSALLMRGLVLSVTGDNTDVRRTLELAGLSHFFPIHEGVE